MENTANNLRRGVDLAVDEKVIVAGLKDVSKLKKASASDVFAAVPPVPLFPDVHDDIPYRVNSSPPNSVADSSNVDNPHNSPNVNTPHDVSRVAALKASELSGPWFHGLLDGVNILFAADMFCPVNIISSAVVRRAGLSIESGSGSISGVGDGQLRFVGTARGQVTIGSTSKSVLFNVSPDIEDFVFFSYFIN